MRSRSARLRGRGEVGPVQELRIASTRSPRRWRKAAPRAVRLRSPATTTGRVSCSRSPAIRRTSRCCSGIVTSVRKARSDGRYRCRPYSTNRPDGASTATRTPRAAAGSPPAGVPRSSSGKRDHTPTPAS